MINFDFSVTILTDSTCRGMLYKETLPVYDTIIYYTRLLIGKEGVKEVLYVLYQLHFQTISSTTEQTEWLSHVVYQLCNLHSCLLSKTSSNNPELDYCTSHRGIISLNPV